MELYGDSIKTKLNERGFEDLSELHRFVADFLLNKDSVIYQIEGYYYRLPAIDVARCTVRLLEVDVAGNFLYDDIGKTIKRKMKFQEFEELAVIK